MTSTPPVSLIPTALILVGYDMASLNRFYSKGVKEDIYRGHRTDV